MSIDITMPRLSDTMESGTILKWSVAEGDEVSSGDVVADVETDKATMELSVYDDGRISKILVPEGKTVDVGTTIALLSEEGDDAAADAADAGDGAGKEARKETGDDAGDDKASDRSADAGQDGDESGNDGTKTTDAPARESAPERSGRTTRGGGRQKVSPVARRLADEHRLDVSGIEGTGPSGRVIKRDVQRAIEAAGETAASVPPSARPAAEAEPASTLPATRVPVVGEPVPADDADSSDGDLLVPGRIELSSMRQTIAKRLVESKTTIPHYQVTMTFDMDPLLDLRKSLNAQLAATGVKLSVNDFLVRCCGLAMHQHPEFNASWGGDHILVHGSVNVGIAISMPAERGGGLVVGVVRDADRRSLREISTESKRLAKKARERGLTIEEMSDSTFTLSNLGMFGVDNFTAIINPPNSAILAVGAAVKKPVVRDDELVIGHEMSATLSSDHRVIDGAMAAQYLATLKGLIESPAAILV